MEPVRDYESLKSRIHMRFQHDFQQDDRHMYMFGICFARPTSILGKSEILPQIPDWHHRSGNHIDFYFAGFSPNAIDDTWIETEIPGSWQWYYSSEMFNKFRSEMQVVTTWKYSGGCDLILANAKYDNKDNDVELDFSTAVVCQLDKMKEIKAFQSVEQYFENIFQYAEESGSHSNTWDFSDQAGISAGHSAIKSIALSCLPKNTGKEIKKISQYAVSDIGRK